MIDKVQYIRDEKGERLYAVVPAAEFDDLVEAAEDLADVAAYDEAKARDDAGAPALSSALLGRLLAGESPIRVWREARGLKAAQLAARADVTPGYLSALEHGKQAGSLRVLRRLATVLEVDLDDLVPMAE